MKAMFRRSLSVVLSLALLLALSPSVFASDALGDDLNFQEVSLHQGTELAEGTFWSNTYSDFRQENYIVYSPNTSVTPIVTYGDYVTARKTVAATAKSLEAQNLRVVAGINGDYYGMANGVPLGTVMTEGILRAASSENYAIGFRADGSAILGAPKLSMRAESTASSFPIASVNQVRYTYGGVFLYTHDFNSRHTTGTSEAGYDVVCSAVDGRLSVGETLTLSVDEILPEATDTVIEEGKYVLTANLLSGEENLARLRALSPGDTLTITVSAADDGWNDVDYMIGALYQLVENGQVCKGLEAGAAPRTAIGQRADGSIILYTIDGRQKGYSIGATLTQVAERMIELGCVTALSLDGGGSTTLSVTLPEDTSAGVYNSPSEGSLRAVTNHIFLVSSNQASGTLDHISLRTERQDVLAGAKVKLTATAVDTNYLPMDLPLTYDSDRGSVSEDGVFTAPTAAGTATVYAKAGSRQASLSVNVIETPDSIQLLRSGKAVSALSLAPGESVELAATAYYKHLLMTTQNSCFAWSTDGNVGTVDENGVLTAAYHAASGSLTVKAGDRTVTIPVTVSAAPLKLLDGFEDAPGQFLLNTNKNYVRSGSASARWDYSADTLSVVQRYALPEGYDRVKLWVYGDGQNETLSLSTDAGETDAFTLSAGWQQLTFRLPDGASAITGFSLQPGAQASGTLYLDQLIAAYDGAEDSTAPEITLALSDDGSTLTGKLYDAVDGAMLTTVRVTYDGKPLNYTFDHQTGALRASLPASDGAVHHITAVAGDASGNLARTGLRIVPQTLAAAFPDTGTHWSNSAVSYLKNNGISNGDDAGLYHPDSNITRQEFAVLLYRYLSPSEDFSSVALPFADASSIADWAKDSVRAMYALGITTGSTDLQGRLCFYPTATISRQEAVTMLGRLLERGYMSPEWNFTDAGQIQSWARGYVNTLCAIGVLSGYGDGGFHPAEPITRAQVASILYNMA